MAISGKKLYVYVCARGGVRINFLLFGEELTEAKHMEGK